MANPTTFPGDLVTGGDLRLTGVITPKKDRDEVLSIEERIVTLPWTIWRKWDAIATNLPATAATDDLGLVDGDTGWATDSPSIQTVDFGGTSTTAYARAQIPVPADYVAGQTFKIRFHAGMRTVADTTCTLDIVCYETDEELGISADLASAASANNIKSASYADVDFTITATNLIAGDLLDVRISINGVDSGDAAANITGVIGAIKLVYNGR